MIITPTDATTATAVPEVLSTRRLNVMRFGYAFMGVGLAIVKWPLLLQDAASFPVMDGVVTCLLTAMSLLAFLGLRYPVRMLPILLFEVAWKLIWIGTVATPHLMAGDMDAETREVLFNCSFVVLIIAVIPWRYVWRPKVVTNQTTTSSSRSGRASRTPACSRCCGRESPPFARR